VLTIKGVVTIQGVATIKSVTIIQGVATIQGVPDIKGVATIQGVATIKRSPFNQVNSLFYSLQAFNHHVCNYRGVLMCKYKHFPITDIHRLTNNDH